MADLINLESKSNQIHELISGIKSEPSKVVELVKKLEGIENDRKITIDGGEFENASQERRFCVAYFVFLIKKYLPQSKNSGIIVAELRLTEQYRQMSELSDRAALFRERRDSGKLAFGYDYAKSPSKADDDSLARAANRHCRALADKIAVDLSAHSKLGYLKEVQKDCDRLLSTIDYDVDVVNVASPVNGAVDQSSSEAESLDTKATGRTKSNATRNTAVNRAKTNLMIKPHTISRRRPDSVHFLLIILLFLAAAIVVFAIIQYISRPSSNSAPATISLTVTNPDPLLMLATSKASVSYQNGIDLYKKQEFLLASEAFTEAIVEQEKITGADSIEVGYVYCMLGLAELYSGQGDPISHLNRGLMISKMNDSPLDSAKCYFYLANAYFEHNQLNRSIENLKSCTDILDSDALVVKYWISYENDGSRVSFPVQSYSADRFYHSCEYYKLMADVYNLYGKIRFMAGSPDLALYYFNAALDNYNLWMTCALSLSVQYSDTDSAGINEYRNSVNISKITDDCIDIKIYQFADDRVTITGAYDVVSLSRSTDVATFLTNRAMSGLSCGKTDLALSDCESALNIFSNFNATERSNISYTYIYYALAKMSYWSDSNDLTSLSEAQQKEILNYISMAVNYDREINRDMPYRLAFSLETLGNTYLLFGKNEDSMAAYSEAYQIYVDLGDSASAKFIKNDLKKIFELEGEQTISFDEWLNVNLS